MEQRSEFLGSKWVVMAILFVINLNYYFGFGLSLADVDFFSAIIYMLPSVLYSLLLALCYFMVGFQGLFHSIAPSAGGGFHFDPSKLLGDLIRAGAFVAITFWPTYAFVLASDATGVGLDPSIMSHIWQYTLAFFLIWLFFFAWTTNGFFVPAFLYAVGGVIFFIATRLWDLATFMTADAETWWGKGLGFIAAFVVGGVIFLFAVYVWTAWMREKVGIDR
jgi:hypothetical protein